MWILQERSFSLCKHPTEFPYTEIIDSNHDLTFFVKNTHFELRYHFRHIDKEAQTLLIDYRDNIHFRDIDHEAQTLLIDYRDNIHFRYIDKEAQTLLTDYRDNIHFRHIDKEAQTLLTDYRDNRARQKMIDNKGIYQR